MSQSLSVITSRPRGGIKPATYDARAGASDVDDTPKDDPELLSRLVSWFEEAERSSIDARTLSERDRDYVDGNQWTREEREALRKRGQPDITINYCRRKIALLCGLERKARTDPKAFPRTPQEEDRADAATQALRFISDDNDFTIIRSGVFENMLVEGYGGAEVAIEDDGKGGANITITHISWERLFHDPHARAHDFADARYLGMVIWMDRDQIEEAYPNAADVIEDTFSASAASYGTYNDRPDQVVWTDNKRSRTRVVQIHWCEDGDWYVATVTKQGFVEPPRKSKMRDRKGKTACSLILQSAYIDRENHRYGMVRDLISLQDELNKRRSKALHLLSVHQVVAEKGAVTDVDHARREIARPDGYIEIMPGMKFEITPGGELASGQFQLLQHATQEMQLSGPNAAMSGTDPRELSGRAILAQQAGGAVQNEPLADSLRFWSRRVYEMAWMAAREFWTQGKWVRITDDLQETRWIGINQPIRLMDRLAEMPDANRAMIMQQMQLMPGDPRLQTVVGKENDITDLDVDITVEEGIDVPTMAAENFQTLVQLAGMQPGLIPGDVLIAASSLKDKSDLLARMKQHMEQQQQQQAEAKPLMQAHAVAQVQKLQGEGAAAAALAQERKVNAVRGVHDMHSEFAAPPYGQPYAQDPPDPPSLPPTDPEQMTPEMAQAHQMADLRAKHANALLTETKAGQTALQAAHEPHKTVNTIASTHMLHHQMNQPPETDNGP